jgi:hypothetical protein
MVINPDEAWCKIILPIAEAGIDVNINFPAPQA